MYNKQIINVLLIGEDERNGDDHGRSDAMIIVSIDTINKQIKMTSVWRDTYGLIQVPKTAKGAAYETYEKINGGCNYAGPETTVKTIQNLYKIRIDGYIDTTFDSFASLIDAMDGVEVSVTEEENNYLLGYTHGGEGYAPYSWPTGHSGDNCHLNGKEALVYARIRKLDSDVKRAERQRKVMNAMIKKMTSLSQTQMLSAVAEYLSAGYVETNFSKNDISNLGKKAYQNGWNNFKMVSNSAPVSIDVDPKNGDFYLGGTYLYPNGGYSSEGVWIWLVDIPKTAQDVQKFIYGETYCVLNDYRHNVKEFNYMFYGAIN